MSRYHSYISSAAAIIEAYKGEEPFVHFAKKHFSAHKKYGSKDRKTISHLCYCYFRCFHVFKKIEVKESLVQALFLCESNSHPVLENIAPALNEKVTAALHEKFTLLNVSAVDIFPFDAALGNEIDKEAFFLSFLKQPLLFLRLRPGKSKQVLSKLDALSLNYTLINDTCIALANATGVSDALQLNREAVVQDKSSQQVFDRAIQEDLFSALPARPEVWDCCAASGGKSILLYDKLKGQVRLTVSDIRKSILHNLQQRLKEAGVSIYRNFIADVAAAVPEEMLQSSHIVICDAPCTGSGTWSRTPEQLAFFKEEKIKEYTALQKKIAINAAKGLQENGLFFYITCSVFSKENEEIVAIIQKETSLNLLHAQYLTGYNDQADTMFIAVLKK